MSYANLISRNDRIESEYRASKIQKPVNNSDGEKTKNLDSK